MKIPLSPPRFAAALFAICIGPVLHASVDLLKFDKLAEWKQPAIAGVEFSQVPDAVRFKLEAVNAPQNREFDLRLKRWQPLPKDTIRIGLWVYVATPATLQGIWVTLIDGKGREFEYTLRRPESWEKGWQFLKTFNFDANEMGKLHPEVGSMLGGGIGLPEGPLSLTGMRFAANNQDSGELLLGRLTAGTYTLGSGGYHWALNIPGRHYTMTQTWIQSGVEPWIMAGQLLPDGGDETVSWEVLAGYQGVPLSRNESHLAFAADDYLAKAKRVGLGALPKGDYEVVVTHRPRDLRGATPDAWRRLVWHAEGNALWDVVPDSATRVLRGEKTGGQPEGYVGWRQMVILSGEGRRAEFSAEGAGSGQPVARLVFYDNAMRTIGETTEIVFPQGRSLKRVSRNIQLPTGAVKLQLDMMTTAPGYASFTGVSLKRDNTELVLNGNVSDGDILRQERWALVVLSSPDKHPLPPQSALSATVGTPLSVPAPSWAQLPGQKYWRILDAKGTKIADGEITEPGAIRWTPPSSGLYRYVAERMEAGVMVDRDQRILGGKTDPAKIGPVNFDARLRVPTEDDLFGPGKNYFTWAMYENHPDQPDFFAHTKQWIADGRAAGFKLIRIRADWGKIERLPGVFDFEMLDRVIEEVRAQGGEVILELRHETPDWLTVEHQLNNHGRADVWRRGRMGRIPSVWTPGMLQAISDYTTAVVRRYRNDPVIAGYHVWGLPGSLDWTTIDKPYWGQRADYSDAAVAAFDRWSGGRYAGHTPMASEDWSRPDLSDGWKDWVAFRRHGLDTFFIDHMLKPIRELDNRRSIVGYFGLDYYSERLTESARSLHWRRHTGGSELYYQIPLQARRAVVETGMAWPHEVHLLTPVPAGLEHATFQISGSGGQGYHWNFYWRNNYPVGSWTENREAGLAEWKSVWAPLWTELRDAKLAQPADMATVNTWSTMQYGLRTYFALRMGDYVTRPAAAMYRDHLAPDWFSDNAPGLDLTPYKLVVVPPVGAQVMPRRLIDNLANYARKGGHVVVFPDSGRWVIEEPSSDNVLWTRLGWMPADGTTRRVARQSSEVGNSGLPMNRNENPFSVATPEPGGTLFAPDQALVIQQSPTNRLGKTGTYRVEARFPDNSPAVISWKYGKGRVTAFAGQPDWAKTPGLMRALYKASGGTLSATTNRPDVEMTHLVKGDTHYVIINRLKDSFRPQLPIAIANLDRATLHNMAPRIDALWSLAEMPDANWRITEITGLSDQGYDTQKSSAELARGLPVKLYLMQTLVFKLEPVTGEK